MTTDTPTSSIDERARALYSWQARIDALTAWDALAAEYTNVLNDRQLGWAKAQEAQNALTAAQEEIEARKVNEQFLADWVKRLKVDLAEARQTITARDAALDASAETHHIAQQIVLATLGASPAVPAAADDEPFDCAPECRCKTTTAEPAANLLTCGTCYGSGETSGRDCTSCSIRAPRCPSCDHLAVFHTGPEGCRHAVTVAAFDSNIVCPCTVAPAPAPAAT